MPDPATALQAAIDELTALFGARQGGKTTVSRCLQGVHDAAYALGRRAAADGQEMGWQVRIIYLPTDHEGPWLPYGRTATEEGVRDTAEPYVGDPDYKVEYRRRPLGLWEMAELPGPALVPCPDGFRYIGQPFTSCDECGLPAWDHAGIAEAPPGAGLFDTGTVLRPWKPGEREAFQARWAPRTERSSE